MSMFSVNLEAEVHNAGGQESTSMAIRDEWVHEESLQEAFNWAVLAAKSVVRMSPEEAQYSLIQWDSQSVRARYTAGDEEVGATVTFSITSKE